MGDMMMEKILSIEIHNVDDYEGYKIVTTKQEILLLIEYGQCCCENYGYFITEDNLKDFCGSELLDIKIVDTELKVNSLKEREINISYGGDVMFVNIETSKGLLQFVAYNEHNGYYGHNAKVISKKLNYEVTL